MRSKVFALISFVTMSFMRKIELASYHEKHLVNIRLPSSPLTVFPVYFRLYTWFSSSSINYFPFIPKKFLFGIFFQSTFLYFFFNFSRTFFVVQFHEINTFFGMYFLYNGIFFVFLTVNFYFSNVTSILLSPTWRSVILICNILADKNIFALNLSEKHSYFFLKSF